MSTAGHEWKKGSAELLILSLLESRPRHGYDLAKLIESRSAGVLSFHVTTLYPLLARLEEHGLATGKWVEKPEQRRRRYYSLTAKGRKTLAVQRTGWKEFVSAIAQVMEPDNA
jgi:PadR family transcriptional regulator PadR